MTEQDFTELEPGALHDESDELDEDNLLKPRFVASVADALGQATRRRAYELVEPLHPATSPTCSSCSSATQRRKLAARDHRPDDPRGLRRAQRPRPRGHDRGAAGQASPTSPSSSTPTTRSQLIEDLEPRTRRVLAEMEPEDRAAIETALSYPEETAGRLMQPRAGRGARAPDRRRPDRLPARRRTS
jgi:magnesium transporter